MSLFILINTLFNENKLFDFGMEFIGIANKYISLLIFYFSMVTQDERRTEEHNVTVVVEFAIALMSVLDQINRESFQRFRLRIGLNHGPVIAGVIGAQKYSIFLPVPVVISMFSSKFTPTGVFSSISGHNMIFGATR